MSLFSFFIALFLQITYSQVPVFWHGDNGVPCIRIPSITMTTTNTLLAFAECRHWTGDGCEPSNMDPIKGGPTYVCMKRSNDNGKTWSTNVTYPVSTKITNSQPTVVYDSKTQTTVLQVTANGSIWQVTSTDSGTTWSDIVDIGTLYIGDTYKDSSVGPGRGLQLTNGRIMFIAHQGAYVHDVIWYSDDGGKTYNLSSTIFPHMDEAQLTQLSNGSVIANMRNNHYFNTNNGNNYRGYSISNDNGKTFTTAIADLSLLSPVCMASIIPYKGKQYFSNPDDAKSRVNMTVKVSDDGFNFSVLKNVYKGPAAYSCLTTVGVDNSIGLLWETNSTDCSGPSCQMVFTLVDV